MVHFHWQQFLNRLSYRAVLGAGLFSLERSLFWSMILNFLSHASMRKLYISKILIYLHRTVVNNYTKGIRILRILLRRNGHEKILNFLIARLNNFAFFLYLTLIIFQTSTAGVQSIHFRPGFLRTQFAYCRPVISRFSVDIHKVYTLHILATRHGDSDD